MQSRMNEPNPNFLTDMFAQRPWAYVEMIMAGRFDNRSKYLALKAMLKTANTAPPAAWVEMRDEYPIKYLDEVMPALIRAEKEARQLVLSFPSAYRDAYLFDLEGEAIHCANHRVDLVRNIAEITMNFKVLVRHPESFKHFLSVIRDDFFKGNSQTNRLAYLRVMRFTLKALSRAESLDHGVLRSVQQCLEVYEANNAKGVWYADYEAVSDLWKQLFELFDKAGLIQAREGRDEAASALLALSGAMQDEERSQGTNEVHEPEGRDQAVQAPKRQKISAQPARLFHPPVVQAPVPVRPGKIRMFVVSK